MIVSRRDGVGRRVIVFSPYASALFICVALRRADDPRTQVSYKEPILGKTDRFVLVFRKQAGH